MDVAENNGNDRSFWGRQTLKRLLAFLVVVSALSCAVLLQVTIDPLLRPPAAFTRTRNASVRLKQHTNKHTPDTRFNSFAFADRLSTFYFANSSNSSRDIFKQKSAENMKQNGQRTIEIRREKNVQQNQQTSVLATRANVKQNQKTIVPVTRANVQQNQQTSVLTTRVNVKQNQQTSVLTTRVNVKQNQQTSVLTTRVNVKQNQQTSVLATRAKKARSFFLNTRNKSIPVVVKRPPWFDLMKNATSDATKDQRVFYLTAGNGGRLGNQLFVYASLFGIAWRNSRIPLWNNDRQGLRKIFTNLRINAKHKSQYSKMKFNNIREASWLRIIDETNHLPPSNIHIHGCLQHTRYFAHVDDQLRHEFTFSPDVMRQAQRKLDAFNTSSLRENGYVRVVIHVRRGDYSQRVDRLFRGQPRLFFRRSMAYFTDCLPKVHFIVISDDVSWCRRNIFGSKVDFFYGKRSPAVDLAIASLCDHAIITVGTFGWWVAWFANGVTVELTQDPEQARRPPANSKVW